MLFSLFGEDGKLDRQAMRKQVDAMVRGGVHGIAVLGLASESNKLSADERRDFIRWTVEDLDSRLPLSVTIPGANVAEQVDLAAFAVDHGADWLVLQPPPVTGISSDSLAGFFGEVVRKVAVPVGVQIAPEYLGNSISATTAVRLNRECPNFSILKVELAGHEVAEMKTATGAAFTLFNGQDGVDLPDSIRGGASGCIPGAECADVLARIYDGVTEGTAEANERADRNYREIAPLISFLMSSIDIFLTYGKPILCRRLGLPEYNGKPRNPSNPVTEERSRVSQHWSRHLGQM
jgi:4-hydroxy-tetrahydrodipicolinate synthase